MNVTAARRLTALLSLMLVATMSLVTTSVVAAPPARASLCITLPIDGSWSTIDPGTRSITRAQVYCADDTRTVCENGVCRTTHGVARYVRLWGACSPTDCDWGPRKLTARHDGWHTAHYDHGFATREVWVRTEQHHGRTYLRVSVWTDYRDSRTDRWTTDWFLR